MAGVFSKILSIGEGAILRKLHKNVRHINFIESDFKNMTDNELRNTTEEYKNRIRGGESLDNILPEAFATVRETSRRLLSQRHYDVQIMGGLALYYGYIAEIKTGEGKTLVSTLPAYLYALLGKGVHIVTVNDYLAQRDADWMGIIYKFLNISVGVITGDTNHVERKNAYKCDITYGTNNEYGFDYLRDNMVQNVEDQVQRGHFFAIIDEADSILIDEARTPLIISGASQDSSQLYNLGKNIASTLVKDTDYTVDKKKRTISLLDNGSNKVEQFLKTDQLYAAQNADIIEFLYNALRAKELYVKDKDYIVLNKRVLIIDEHTGRLLPDRRYNAGIHQSIEAKESVPIQNESITLGSISIQHYFKLYKKLSGMTGTARSEAAELYYTYKMHVVSIPTNVPVKRIDNPDIIYKTAAVKYKMIVKDIIEHYKLGQPILIGTSSVEKSEHLSKLLKEHNIPHNVLNAKFHKDESILIANAGRKYAVTVATNMAGRGTDITLGGNPYYITREYFTNNNIVDTKQSDKFSELWTEKLHENELKANAEHEEVVKLGGLYVIGTERHESRRLDDQLRGRSGRQGDPGKSQFYLSFEDDLLRIFKPEAVKRFLSIFDIPDDTKIDSKIITRTIETAQRQIEQQNFETRKQVFKYDEVIDHQRKAFFAKRASILVNSDNALRAQTYIQDAILFYINKYIDNENIMYERVKELQTALVRIYPIQIDLTSLTKDIININECKKILYTNILKDVFDNHYFKLVSNFKDEDWEAVNRSVILSILDNYWKDHITTLNLLQNNIFLRTVGQKDPFLEYKFEAYTLACNMMSKIKENVCSAIMFMTIKDDGIEVSNYSPERYKKSK